MATETVGMPRLGLVCDRTSFFCARVQHLLTAAVFLKLFSLEWTCQLDPRTVWLAQRLYDMLRRNIQAGQARGSLSQLCVHAGVHGAHGAHKELRESRRHVAAKRLQLKAVDWCSHGA